MIRTKTFDSTGVAPGGKLFAGDLNLIQDVVAALSDFAQTHDVAILRIGDTSLALQKFGTGELWFNSLLRVTGIFRSLAGFVSGTYTTTARDAITAGNRPFGLVILNSTTNRYEFNSGTDAAPVWKALFYNIVDADIAAGAAISKSKLAALNIVDADVTGPISGTKIDMSVVSQVSPLGAIMDYAGTTDPNASWLICDGRSLLRAGTYANLFAVLGTTYGSVDGTHFNIPDCRGRVTVGVDGAAVRLSGPDTLGASSGEESHTLTAAELAVHTHAPAAGMAAYAGTSFIGQVAAGTAFAAVNSSHAATGNGGGGSSHNNMQPYIVTNKIIRVI